MSKPRKPGVPRYRRPAKLPPPTRAPLGGLTPKVGTLQNIAAEQQRHALGKVAEEMAAEGWVETAVSVHRNRDGTVDGELRMFNIRHGYTINEILIDLEGFMREHSLPKGHWVSAGALTDWGTKEQWQNLRDEYVEQGYTPEEAAELARQTASPLPRYKGLGRVAMYPQRFNKMHIHMKAARERLFKPQEGIRHKPQQVLIRVYWNPEGERPGKR